MKITAYKAQDDSIYESEEECSFHDRMIDFLRHYSIKDNNPIGHDYVLIARIIRAELGSIRTLVGYDIINTELAVMTEERDILRDALGKAAEAMLHLPVSESELNSDKFKSVRSVISEALAALEAVNA